MLSVASYLIFVYILPDLGYILFCHYTSLQGNRRDMSILIFFTCYKFQEKKDGKKIPLYVLQPQWTIDLNSTHCQ